MTVAKFPPFYFLAISFYLHVLEEFFFGFPQWASSHFAPTSERFYILSHIPLVIAVTFICWQSSRRSSYQFAGMGLAAILMVNGAFHGLATIVFSEYSPGVITGIGLFPVSYYMVLTCCLKSKTLTISKVICSSFIGAVVSLVIIGSLFFEMAK